MVLKDYLHIAKFLSKVFIVCICTKVNTHQNGVEYLPHG